MSESAAKKDIQKLQRAIVDGLEDVKAQDIRVFNTEHLSPLFERVIVASGSSNRQTKALAASVRDKVRDGGFAKPRIEGEENGEWIIVDCGPAVAHIMQPPIRQYYNLEEIWGEKPVRLKGPAARVAAKRAAKDKAAADKAAAKPRKPAAEQAAATPSAARKSPAKAPVKKSTAGTPARKTAARKAVAKAPARAAAGAGATRARPATPRKRSTSEALQTVVVNKPSARGAAKSAAAPAPRSAARAPAKAPAKAAAKTARKPAPRTGR
ncbi:ribosome silencing factor [Ottowia sp. SB7-C50]|uniref:ribosome silencing factor n=1 Tax=Ottowia sp. SB7-C50 TaxID=3081231 RepID=UPI0029548FB7|nr:ribosome silencing factor [Ottowia sp. SB7-C50]WOP14616.1 ribosome silencing factor [Ottowia sp. SB7-C50]